MPVSPEQLYEQTLVLRSQIGDEAAFAELLNLYGPRLLAFTQRLMTRTPEHVADLTQEIWVAIYRGLPRLQQIDRFKPWAFRIARDCVYREFRRRQLLIEPLDDDAAIDRSIELDDAAAVNTEELQQCLAALSVEHREALVLRFFEEMSYEDIAQATGVTVGTVRSRIHYGKHALRVAWKGRAL